MASIGLLIIWLFAVQVTGKKQNHPIYNHLKAIEGALTKHSNGITEDAKDKEKPPLYSFGTHKLLDESACWVRFRRMLWGLVLFLLSLSWLLLSVKVWIYLI